MIRSQAAATAPAVDAFANTSVEAKAAIVIDISSGKTLYEKNPEHVGSLGIAISEGLEDSQKDPKATYCLGSVLNHLSN